MMRQLRHDLFHSRAGRRRNVMDRNDQRIRVRSAESAKMEEQRCRSGAGHAGFSIPSGPQTSLIGRVGTSRCDVRGGGIFGRDVALRRPRIEIGY